MYTCKECKKSKQAKKGIRLSKLQLKNPGEKE
jgi:ribosomal protein L44E